MAVCRPHPQAEAATVLGQLERSLHRRWRFIKAWLKSRLAEPDPPKLAASDFACIPASSPSRARREAE
jgi:hypothetical protein